MSKNISVLLICFVFIVFAFVDATKLPEVQTYELKNKHLSVKVTNWGATILSVLLPDKKGKVDDVVLGFQSVQEYKNDTEYFGALVGRVANRISGAKFTLNGTTYKLDANEGNNTLHGGKKGFSDVIWRVRTYEQNEHRPRIVFIYKSRDGEGGFPGELVVTVSYMLLDSKFSVKMLAKAVNKATPVNLVQHTYWNLGGHNSGNILKNKVQIFRSHITPLDASAIPTGKIVSVKGTPYDFLQPHTVGSTVRKLPIGEYNINYVLDGQSGGSKRTKVAIVHEKKSGRMMELWSNQLGVQFYTAYWLKNVKGKDGAVYGPYGGLCLETQGFPDAVNHPNFPSVIVNPGKPYKHSMLFKFSTK